jgi:hypothetical protein
VKRWNVWIGVSAVAVLAAVAIVSAQRAAEAPQGQFEFTKDPNVQRDALAVAIEGATAELPDETRYRWRAQLEEMARPSRRVSLERKGVDFAVTAGSGVELRSPTNSTLTPLPGSWQLEQHVPADGVLEQRILNDSIDQVYRYSLAADGQELIIDVRITAPVLSRPITYQLSYSRQS